MGKAINPNRTCVGDAPPMVLLFTNRHGTIMENWILTIVCWGGIVLSIASVFWFTLNTSIVAIKALRGDDD